MVYTIGNTISYRKGLIKSVPFQKLGRTRNYKGGFYPGGSVWKTAFAAYAYLVDTNQIDRYSVFEVDADWISDTAPSLSGDAWNDLLKTSTIVREILKEELMKNV